MGKKGEVAGGGRGKWGGGGGGWGMGDGRVVDAVGRGGR